MQVSQIKPGRMKKIIFTLALLSLFSCQKEEVKPTRNLWSNVKFKIGTCYKWNHEQGIKSVTIEVDGQHTFIKNIENQPGYAGSECSAGGFGYSINTREDFESRHFVVKSDRGEILSYGELYFRDPTQTIFI